MRPLIGLFLYSGNFEKGEFRGLGYYKSEESDFEYFGEFKKDKEELAWAHIEYDNGIHYDGDTLQLNRQGHVSQRGTR